MVPDVLRAVLLHLRADSGLMTLTGGRIAGALRDEWHMPVAAIVLQRVGGPPADHGTRRQFQRIQMDCYGPQDYLAYRTWATAHPVLCPLAGKVSFVAEGCVVQSIVQAAAPITLPTDSGHPRVIVDYIVGYSEQAAA